MAGSGTVVAVEMTGAERDGARAEGLRPAVTDGSDGDRVILLHGMLATRRSMRRLEESLATDGYGVINWGYPSLTHSITDHSARLGRLLDRLEADAMTAKIHAVTHSMGGIILRTALRRRKLRKAGRIVMLAPPNAGTRLASLPLGPLQRWFPQMAELSLDTDSLVNRLPEPWGLEIGVIAARNDLVVGVESTHLRCQRDHLVLPTTHQRLPAHKETVRQVLAFLRCGRFPGTGHDNAGSTRLERAA